MRRGFKKARSYLSPSYWVGRIARKKFPDSTSLWLKWNRTNFSESTSDWIMGNTHFRGVLFHGTTDVYNLGILTLGVVYEE